MSRQQLVQPDGQVADSDSGGVVSGVSGAGGQGGAGEALGLGPQRGGGGGVAGPAGRPDRRGGPDEPEPPAYEADPALAALRLDFAATVRELLQVTIVGLLARSSR